MHSSFATGGGYHASTMYDNHLMNRPPASRLVRLLQAPFTRRAWAEILYSLITFPLAVAGFVFTVAGIGNGLLWPRPRLVSGNSAPPTACSPRSCSANT